MSECSHPECDNEATGGEINGAAICIEHIEWAMGKAFQPVHELRKLLEDDDDAARD